MTMALNPFAEAQRIPGTEYPALPPGAVVFVFQGPVTLNMQLPPQAQPDAEEEIEEGGEDAPNIIAPLLTHSCNLPHKKVHAVELIKREAATTQEEVVEAEKTSRWRLRRGA